MPTTNHPNFPPKPPPSPRLSQDERIKALLTPSRIPASQKPHDRTHKRSRYSARYFLSDTAHAYLSSLAPSPRTLSNSLSYLLSLYPSPEQWQDTRSDELKESDLPRLTIPHTSTTAPLAPIWCDPYAQRMPHGLNLPPDTITLLSTLSLHFIISTSPFIMADTPRRHAADQSGEIAVNKTLETFLLLTPTQRASAVLEAIGLSYLTPTHPYPITHYLPLQHSAVSSWAYLHSPSRRITNHHDYTPEGTFKKPPPPLYRNTRGYA